MQETARDIAFHIIYEINENNAYSNLILNKRISRNEIQEIDKSLIVKLVYGTIQNKINLDFIIERFSDINIKNISVSVLNILRMAIYQIVFLDSIPDYAILNESVELAKKYANVRAGGYVNAILRRILKNRLELYGDKKVDLDLKYSFPMWMINIIKKQIGEENIEDYLKSTHEKPDLIIRANLLKTTVDSLFEKLENENYKPKRIEEIEEAIAVLNPSGIFTSDLYLDGLFSVQDLGAMIAVDLLDPKPGDILIDVCAAPGGKSMFSAERMENKGKVYSFDVHDHKMELLNESAKRLGINILEASILDGTINEEKFNNIADKIIVDVPCSGFGVIRRKPEIKNRVKGEDLDSLQKLQTQILKNVSKYLKVGGKLLYCTCTLNKKENQNIINSFLEKNTDFKQVGESKILLPHINNTDGFFIAILTRG